MYTLAIGSASEGGHFPWYGERCASTMATAYSSGAYWDQMIVSCSLPVTKTYLDGEVGPLTPFP